MLPAVLPFFLGRFTTAPPPTYIRGGDGSAIIFFFLGRFTTEPPPPPFPALVIGEYFSVLLPRSPS